MEIDNVKSLGDLQLLTVVSADSGSSAPRVRHLTLAHATWPREKRGLRNFFDEFNQSFLYRIITLPFSTLTTLL